MEGRRLTRLDRVGAAARRLAGGNEVRASPRQLGPAGHAFGRLSPPSRRVGQALTLCGICCDRAVGFGPHKVLSVPDAIAQVLIQHEKEKEGVQQDLPLLRAPLPSPASGGEGARGGVETAAGTAGAGGGTAAAPQASLDYRYDPGQTFIGTCPECKSDLQYSEGCVKCLACGYSECG